MKYRFTPITGRKPFGLGDAVALVARPVARAIDAAAGTNLVACAGCAKRREALNRAVPSLLPGVDVRKD